MRHQKRIKKFKRTEEERKRLWIDLCQALILEEKVVTFTARAKWFAPKFERLVTLCKRAGDDRKLAYSKVRPFLSEKVARKLIEVVVPRLADRESGYTSVIKLDEYFNEHDKSVVMIVGETSIKQKEEKPVKPANSSKEPAKDDESKSKTEVVVESSGEDELEKMKEEGESKGVAKKTTKAPAKKKPVAKTKTTKKTEKPKEK